MELLARRRDATERCPYCHDLIVGAPDLESELIVCAGCGTQHHEVCIAELGRCTVRGCERPIVVTRTPERDARLASRSAIYREVHRRISERARTFVRNNCRPPGETSTIVPEREWPSLVQIRETLLTAYRARRHERWAEAAAAFEEAERLISALPPDVRAGQVSTTADDARAFARAMRDRSNGIVGSPFAVAARWQLAVIAVVVAVVLARFYLR